MQAAAVGDLGLGLAEFWSLTPRHFLTIWKRFEAAEARQDRRAATITSVLAEINRDKDKKPTPFTVSDFMPQRSRTVRNGQERSEPDGFRELTESEVEALSPEDQAAYVAQVCFRYTTGSISQQKHHVTAALQSAKIRQ